jgi:hypothetical protein
MALMGRLVATPEGALVAGDVRANENFALSATHTLFALEHNKIVNALPNNLSAEQKFQIARKVVGAEQQFITYNEFLPALGVDISAYRGYDPGVNASITNEFATVGYRAHSMIHGNIDPTAPEGTYTAEQLEAFEEQGIEIEHANGEVTLETPLNLAFGNPDLFREIGLAPVLLGLGREREYRNDEMIDNQLRSVLFQVPVSGNPECLDGPGLPECFDGVVDLGAIDIERGRDHGMPRYNDLRAAYGLAPKTSFTAITGESTESFPNDPEIDHNPAIDDPDILDFVELRDADGNLIPLESPEAQTEAVSGTRRTTTAARLKAIYGNPRNLDAFVGMVAERHQAGSDLGQLQRAIWKRQFEALRDGDRFFYANDPDLPAIQSQFGISYQYTLAQIIRRNTDLTVRGNVFEAAE